MSRKSAREVGEQVGSKFAKTVAEKIERDTIEEAAINSAEAEAKQVVETARSKLVHLDSHAKPQLPKSNQPLKPTNEKKMRSQMKKRGWTEQEIREAFQTEGVPTPGKINQGTRYTHPKKGRHRR